MISFRFFLINLLELYLIYFEDHNGNCFNTVWQPPSPNISLLPAVSGKQRLVVSWLVNHSDLMVVSSEVQISRTENHIIFYSENVSVPSAHLDKYTWIWTSDLPLECVDHSVRIRHFYRESVLSLWSNWTTNPGVKTKDKLEIFPIDSVLREGSSPMFCCIPPPGVNITSMHVRGKSYPLLSIGARVKAIAVHNLTMQNTIFLKFNLFLSCSGTAGAPLNIINFVSFPPQKPTNLSCVTSNIITVTCTWDPIEEQIYNPQTTLHLVNSDRAPISCRGSSCTFPTIPQLEEYKISVVVKNKLGEETETYSFNIYDRVSPVVQWDKVSPQVTDANVSWIVQGNLTQLNVLCQVTDPHHTIELSCNSVNSPCKVQLEHLIPNTLYSARVRCSVGGRLWGKWTKPISFTTYPSVTVNVWRRIEQQSNPHRRQVTLLWTLVVPGFATKVAIEGYTVQWLQDGRNKTERKVTGQTETEVSIGPGQYDFTVQAVLSIQAGLSIPAHITISKADVRENLPVEKRLSSSAAGGFSLSWAEQVTATCGYAVEWCIQGIVMPCTLQWMKIPERNNTLFLPARKFNAGSRYTFNIYGCTKNEYRLLEIQTGYSQELKPVQLPNLGKSIKTSSSVTLEWHYNETDPAHPAFITGYLVVVTEMLPNHTTNVVDESVTGPHRKYIIIEGLQENHEYTIHVSALSKKGPGRAIWVTIRTKSNYSAHLAKILTPILLLLGCTIILWPQRKMLKEIFAYPAGMNIKTSELNAFLNKTGEIALSHKPEECVSCDIEILNTSPPVNEMTTLNKLPSPGSFPSSLSPSSVPLQADYCPQSVTQPCGQIACQQKAWFLNKSYFYSMVEDVSEPQQVMSQSSFEPDGLQDSCSIVYGYISNDNGEKA